MMFARTAIVKLFSFALATTLALHANAAVITSPVSVLQNTAGDLLPIADIGNIIDQSGLSVPFQSGVDDFDTYIAGNPLHTILLENFEWFATFTVMSGNIDLDMGSQLTISRLALWNTEGFGIQTLSVQTSNDPAFASSTNVGSFNAMQNPNDIDYPAQVFSLTPSVARYVRLSVGSSENNMGIGEVAFATSSPPTNTVPEPSTLVVWSLLGLMVSASWRRR